MRRVMVIGCSGAGKSWLAERIAASLDLPLISLDAEFWRPGWTMPDPDDWLRRVDQLSAAPDWVMDGNYAGTLEVRVPRADAVIFLDLPRWRCMAGLLRRTLANRGRVRRNMAEGCPERLDFDFLRHAWRCRVAIRDNTLAAIDRLRPGQRGIVLRSRAEMRAFHAGLPGSLLAAA